MSPHLNQTYTYVEDTIRQRLVEWINRIIEEENLPFDRADAQIQIREPDGTRRSYPDIVIWERRLHKAVCIIELKQPYWSPFDWSVINDALGKAMRASPQIPYFATWNINDLILWKTFDEEAVSFEDRRKGIYSLANIRSLREIDYPNVEEQIRSKLRIFLKDLVEIIYKRRLLPKIPIDEYFIYSLRKIVDTFYRDVAAQIMREVRRNKRFKDELVDWFVLQGWTPPSTNEDYEKVARQYLYLLLNKVIFYNVLRKSFKLRPLSIPEDVDTYREFKEEIQGYFDIATRISGDYETIFGMDFLEKIPMPDYIIPSLVSFINGLSKYDFTKIGYRDLGHILDSLIPEHHRHLLGQYFTNPDVVDIINTFCIRDPDAKVADFGCGAGTFLVRAYARIKYLDPSKTHEEILRQLLGVDISKFAAHLSMINLAIRDLSSPKNYPQIIPMDFFKIKPAGMDEWMGVKKAVMRTLSGEEVEVEIPPVLDAVVGNPPYTRQEEIEEYVKGYKKTLQKVIESDWSHDAKLGGRAGIYAYFFMHGLRFLKNGGRFGYITSNSWLDVDYGKYLQEFFLKHTKIIAIIQPKERVFEDADINTVITILEKCDDEEERNENIVKFVRIEVPLKELIPNTDEETRFDEIEKLIRLIESTKELYKDGKIRIYPVRQKDLWEEGYDIEKNRYAGSNWSKYIRAPDIFFRILERGGDLFVRLEDIGYVIGGIITGCNEFFYLTEDDVNKWNIEKEFLLPVVKTPKELTKIRFTKNDLKYKLFYVTCNKDELKNTNAFKYILYGESKGFNKRPTLRNKREWYRLPYIKRAPLLWVDLRWAKHICHLNLDNVPFEHNYYGIKATSFSDKLLCAYLNSTLAWLFIEVLGRTSLGEGAIRLVGLDIRKFPVIDFTKLGGDKS